MAIGSRPYIILSLKLQSGNYNPILKTNKKYDENGTHAISEEKQCKVLRKDAFLTTESEKVTKLSEKNQLEKMHFLCI